MTYTPGPYEIVTADIGDEFACIVPVCINAANGRTVISDNGGLAPDDEEWHSEELFANAHLFAAAPDMLAALKLALKQIKETQDALLGQGLQVAGWHLNGDLEPVESFFSDSDCGAVEAIEAAIAKAEGRTA